ncbi:unnamed protein product [Cladocopium goreaui]|uniref:Uncharacterized protein n=1 Tax=Cladocopium goreaui TaxID=2562237 RepID=A0A9P1CWH1_9DINO|nr:unnamed protein product [Cladocopium goreaui]
MEASPEAEAKEVKAKAATDEAEPPAKKPKRACPKSGPRAKRTKTNTAPAAEPSEHTAAKALDMIPIPTPARANAKPPSMTTSKASNYEAHELDDECNKFDVYAVASALSDVAKLGHSSSLSNNGNPCNEPSNSDKDDTPHGAEETEDDRKTKAKLEQKKRYSRKSCAYRKAKTEALKNGKTQEEAAAAAKKVLLIIWSCDTSTKYELVELFAGKGDVGREWRSAGRAVGQFDWDYCPAGMNFTGNGGFATAIQMILCLMPMGLVLMGPDCSSWTVISRGTSWRAPHNFWGNLTLPWIQQANLMISRLTLTMMLTVALGCKFLCEQPSGTEPVFARHHRFEEFCNMCCFVFKQRFWMQLHGAPSPKPTSMWSNDDYILDGLVLAPAVSTIPHFTMFNIPELSVWAYQL